jgi:hypothetical protein
LPLPSAPSSARGTKSSAVAAGVGTAAIATAATMTALKVTVGTEENDSSDSDNELFSPPKQASAVTQRSSAKQSDGVGAAPAVTSVTGTGSARAGPTGGSDALDSDVDDNDEPDLEHFVQIFVFEVIVNAMLTIQAIALVLDGSGYVESWSVRIACLTFFTVEAVCMLLSVFSIIVPVTWKAIEHYCFANAL